MCQLVAETAAKAGSEAAPSQEVQQELTKAQEELNKAREELKALKEEVQKKQEDVSRKILQTFINPKHNEGDHSSLHFIFTYSTHSQTWL